MDSLWVEDVSAPVAASVRDRGSYGARGELLATVELLDRGFAVAVPVVDDGVDLVVDYRLKIQVKRSCRRHLEPVPGYNYDGYAWAKVGTNRLADFFVLIGEGDEGRQWFVVPADVIRHFGVKNQLNVFRGSRRGVSAAVWEYEDAWDLLRG